VPLQALVVLWIQMRCQTSTLHSLYDRLKSNMALNCSVECSTPYRHVLLAGQRHVPYADFNVLHCRHANLMNCRG
jgi:hypothetical protein